MNTDQNSAEYVRAFLARQTHMTIAVICSDGTPWAVPVHVQKWDGGTLEWESSIDSLHSQAILAEPRIAISMYELTAGGQNEFGFYVKAHAQKVADVPNQRARYQATIDAAWINGQDHVKRDVPLDWLKRP